MPEKMLFRTLIPFLLALPLAFAHRIEIEAGEKECFYEVLAPQDKMTVTYEVGGGGHLDIDFYVTDPQGKVIHTKNKQPQGSWSITASQEGRFTFCFSNEMSSYTTKTLSFNVHGQLYMGDDEQIAPVEQEVRDLSAGLQLVKDEQAYLVVRERVHRNTCESTNSRVKWWSIAQIVILLAVCGWNIHYLKSWFEVKRVL
ncbi:COPII-coated vesicle protein [Cryptococcus neoformans C23]|uniref:COPII-coated vesicle protein n=2 Tax=Cryptococcus neoformans TaxID=5207 RepID=J9VD46_CRYN9|nr:COPII-coated vesicle protein [Cryptococcus neoformans var. grubii H99]AUB21607.1 COPII-coated vesicle protein [Cryptococcus neoformans var. grubii]OWZ37444.1 COPII-coated vesicle protein [Cryptococcus neoformans var. grubii AD2-60a]OWZ48617.1 COPII-coated vesicle protein [Cryptococcus neoformans var. grubii C23]OXC87570.1 COPII-coated vesicle protein [Cryptococcus neoformans var. grubii AD1-7a]AFR92202.2 COPII-coated vesicle protein [Cryptococcus neoformans var. grubii H99]|eukprot:XP_012046168.1 COPII-coated vesicle protein [Cryptococcus neoformans var. grubii H99]